MSGYCSPAIVAEMTDWTDLGGANWGCYGNTAHTYGFHRAGSEVPVSDYSRSHEPGRPYNMAWACAGDYAHRGDPGLRARHAVLLGRLMASDPALSMVCEYIGQPWPQRPVYYWARWDGIATLQRYTGQGHDLWSHVSLWRSRANERPYLWQPQTAPTPTPTPTPTPVPAPAPDVPKWPGRFLQYRAGWVRSQRYIGDDVATVQRRLVSLGYLTPADVDGDFGPHTSAGVHAFQQHEQLVVDGIVGRISWGRLFTAAHR